VVIIEVFEFDESLFHHARKILEFNQTDCVRMESILVFCSEEDEILETIVSADLKMKRNIS
jgi:hypothetical protein